MATPDDRKYSKTHEWVKMDAAMAVIGISDHAQDALGDITFVEMPKIGAVLTRGKEFGVIESVKAASDLYAPVSGEVAEVNTALETGPEIINQAPYEAGWIIKLKNVKNADFGDIMDAKAYDAFLASEQ